MGFEDKVLRQANKLARKSPGEIALEIEREELEKLMRLKRLAEAANKYLESADIRRNSDNRSPIQSEDNKFTYFPAGPDRAGLNPVTAAAINDLFVTAAREVAERNRRKREIAKAWSDAFEQGGEEAAKEALKERLQERLTLSSDE
jgi:hypothetical protein